VIALAGHALGLDLTPMQAFAALTAFNVATAVPSPGNAGSFEAGGTLALAAFGIPKETALAFIFLYHLTQVLPGFVGGILVLAIEGEQIFGRGGCSGCGGPASRWNRRRCRNPIPVDGIC